MKALLLAILLLATLMAAPWARAGDRASVIKLFEDSMRGEMARRGYNPNDLKISDTGNSVPDGQAPCPKGLGDCPILDVYYTKGSSECLFAAHPTEPMSAVLICAPREPEVDS